MGFFFCQADKSLAVGQSIGKVYFHSMISTDSPSQLFTSINVHSGCFDLHALIARNRMRSCLPDISRSFSPNFAERIFADSPFSKSPLGSLMLPFFPLPLFTVMRIAYSTKICTISPSADSTSTRFPVIPWESTGMICFQSTCFNAPFPDICATSKPLSIAA